MKNPVLTTLSFVILLLSGCLLIYSGFTPQSTSVDNLKNLSYLFGIDKVFHLFSSKLPISNLDPMLEDLLNFQKNLSKLGGLLVVTGAIFTIVPYLGIGGRILVAVGSGTALPQIVIITYAYYLLNGQVGLILSQLFWLFLTIEGIGVTLALVGGFLSIIAARSTSPIG